MSVTLSDDEARALATLVARSLVVETREHGARPTSLAVDILRRLTLPTPTPEATDPSAWLSVAEAARRMGCSAAYARRLAAAGRIVAEKCGPVWAIRWPATVAAPQPRARRSSNIAA